MCNKIKLTCVIHSTYKSVADKEIFAGMFVNLFSLQSTFVPVQTQRSGHPLTKSPFNKHINTITDTMGNML